MKSIDSEILKYLQTDQRKGFELIYRHYYGALCLHAARFFDDKDDAEDVVQKTLVKLWGKCDDLRNVVAIKTYLFRCVHNACVNELRQDKIKKVSYSDVDKELLEIANDVDDFELIEEQYRLLNEAVNNLPPQSKKILEMKKMQGLSYNEIAEQLNISPRTVDNHLSQAMRSLRGLLNKESVIVTIMWFVMLNGFLCIR